MNYYNFTKCSILKTFHQSKLKIIEQLKRCICISMRNRIARRYFQLKSFHTNALEAFKPNLRIRTQRHFFGKILQNPPPENQTQFYKTIHGKIIVAGFQSDTFLSNILITAYSKIRLLVDAVKVFDKMPERNLITWSSMISVYAREGFNEEALVVFLDYRRRSDNVANEFVLTSVVRACVQLGYGKSGKQVHCLVLKMGFVKNGFVGSSLVDFYSKMNEIEKARSVFDDLIIKSAVSWTIMISGYARSGRSDVSLQLFEAMSQNGIVPDRYILSTVLVACSKLEFLLGGKQIHAYVLRRNGEMDVSLTNSLMDLYLKCGCVEMGRRLFHQMTIKNVISWTTIISGYMQNSFDYEAIRLFTEMNQLGFKPDGFACTSALTSCGALEAYGLGKQVHAYVIKGNLEYDEFVRNSLIDMYSKCNCLNDARRAFDSMPHPDAIPFNAMIEGYSRQEKLHEALNLFNDMRLQSFVPNLLTFVSLLGLSASVFAIELSKQIHGMITKFGIYLEQFAGTALIDVYSKCGFAKEARLIFEKMNSKDIVVWNAMLFGYALQSENEEALKLFLEMQFSVQRPNAYTFVSLLTAASNLASLPHGKQFHNVIIKLGLDFDPYVANAVLDMYAKCGSIKEAKIVFDSSSCSDVVFWNSMITTYAQHGEAEEALTLYREMIKRGIEPNYVTFIGVLSACSHAGLVDDGFCYFNSMPSFGIEPGTEHYACMVSLLGRAGKLLEANEVIKKMPIKPEAIIWRSLLTACRTAGNVELGKYAADMAISSDPKDSGSYVLLSNILASKGMWTDVKEIRKRMDFNKVVKEAGCSWLELNYEVHVFIARDKSHPKSDLIWEALGSLLRHIKGLGYVPENIFDE